VVDQEVPQSMSVVEVWQEPSRLWRWRYLEPPEDGARALELLSNEVYERREAAVEAAMTAYPGVAVRERAVSPGERPAAGARRAGGIRSPGRLLALLGLAAVLLAWRRRAGRGHADR
jgi:hypothetical protein